MTSRFHHEGVTAAADDSGTIGGAMPDATENQSFDASAEGNPSTNSEDTENKTDSSSFECNICLDIARDAVISFCGHLFCWPCLHRWLETRPMRQVCPVCKAGISKDKVIPVYGKDNPDRKDPREKLPPRPQAQRPEPENNYNPFAGNFFGGFNQGRQVPGANNGGLQFSFGIGAFPFTFLSWTFGQNNTQPGAPQDTQQQREEHFLSRAFLWVAVFFIIWLIYA